VSALDHRREVRRLRAAGLSFNEIAAQLGISYNKAWRLASDDHQERARVSSQRWKARHRNGAGA
jgi:hypothetical protein